MTITAGKTAVKERGPDVSTIRALSAWHALECISVYVWSLVEQLYSSVT
jgi:hypothetical protein